MEIPGYKIERELGAGGMATVWLALQESLHREVALKIMTPGLAVDETYCHRFLKEGRITAQLNHRNLLTVFDTGVHENHYYMASEYLPGGTVRDKMRDGVSVNEICRIIGEIAAGLGFAHSKGFVHRDVKPGNMLFRGNGDCVLGDFGIAKAVDSNTGATKLGTSIGTPHYMSPEQAKGEKVDHRTDLYSLGVVFYEMLTGSPPFDAEDPFSVALMQINDPVPQLPKPHDKFQGVIEKLMAKDRDLRYATAEEFIQDLASISGFAPQAAQTGSVPAASTVSQGVASSDNSPTAAVDVPSASGGGAPLTKIIIGVTLALVVGVGGWQAYSRFGAGGEGDPVVDVPAQSGSMPSSSAAPSRSQAAATDYSELFDEAEAHMRAGRYFEPSGRNAIGIYRQILAQDPDNEDAQLALRTLGNNVEQAAEVAWASGELERAYALLVVAVKEFPDDSGLSYLMGQVRSQYQPDPGATATSTVDTSVPPVESISTPPIEVVDTGRMDELTRLADKYYDANIFSHPPGENATDVYLQVLEIQADNAHALERLNAIADTWASAAETNLKRGKVNIARRMIEKGLQASPDHEKLQALQRRADEMEG